MASPLAVQNWGMKFILLRRLGLILGLMFVGQPTLWAQKQVTAQEVQAAPAKYDGQKVFVFVQGVEFPAVHIDQQRQFSEFWVVTADDSSRGGGGPGIGGGPGPHGPRPGGDFGGGIVVRVPASEVDRFSQTHAIKAGQNSTSSVRKKITAIFRACKSGRGGYLDMTDGSAAGIDPAPPGSGPRKLPPHGPKREGVENDRPGPTDQGN